MRFLAVSENVGDPTPYLEEEMGRMATLTDSGVVEQLFLKADRSGAVLIVQAADEGAAAGQLATLPLVEHQITSFTLTPLASLPG